MKFDHPHQDQIPGLRQLWKKAFGDTDAFLDLFFSTGFHPLRCRCILDDHRIVAALYWFDICWDNLRGAYLYAVATAKAFQGQGLCRFLMEDTHQQLAKQGYAGTILVPGSDGLRRMYEKLGYTTATTLREFTREAGDEAFPVTEISRAEYARLRAVLLPEGGIAQEGAGLAFLETYTSFYAGKACLLCAVKDGKKLFVPEFLGDEAHIPGILRYLNCKEGTIRTPGEEKPFAMYRSLTDDTSAPRYFAHAFD